MSETPDQGFTAGQKVDLLIDFATAHGLRTLVETGIWMGGGSGMGAVDAGVVDRYVVIDWQAENCAQVAARYPEADVRQGDSAELLPALVKQLKRPALFWLDAHGIPSDEGFPPCPLWLELEALAASKVPHVVLVDDLHMMGSHDWPTLEALRAWVEAQGCWSVSEAGNVMRLVPTGQPRTAAGRRFPKPTAGTARRQPDTSPEEAERQLAIRQGRAYGPGYD